MSLPHRSKIAEAQGPALPAVLPAGASVATLAFFAEQGTLPFGREWPFAPTADVPCVGAAGPTAIIEGRLIWLRDVTMAAACAVIVAAKTTHAAPNRRTENLNIWLSPACGEFGSPGAAVPVDQTAFLMLWRQLETYLPPYRVVDTPCRAELQSSMAPVVPSPFAPLPTGVPDAVLVFFAEQDALPFGREWPFAPVVDVPCVGAPGPTAIIEGRLIWLRDVFMGAACAVTAAAKTTHAAPDRRTEKLRMGISPICYGAIAIRPIARSLAAPVDIKARSRMNST